jgi:hypothetical protein
MLIGFGIVISGAHIGPEPTTDRFVVVMVGTHSLHFSEHHGKKLLFKAVQHSVAVCIVASTNEVRAYF